MARYFTGITQDQKLTTFYTTGANIDTLKHVIPDAFLVFTGFDMANRGEQNIITMTDKTKVDRASEIVLITAIRNKHTAVLSTCCGTFPSFLRI